MATAPGPPGPDESKASIIVGVVGALHLISYLLYGARIWTRVRPSFRLSLDDYLITGAVIFDAISFGMLLAAVHYGVGKHNFYVPDDKVVLAEKWLFISQPPFPWALALSKMSIAWMLIRIQRERPWWTWTMYFLMFTSFGVAVVSNIFQLSACKPLWAVWDHSNPDAVCTDPNTSQISIYVTACITIVTDVALSLAPLTFIVTMHRPFREKAMLAFVMGLGIVASSASIAKTVVVGSYGKTGDSLMDTVPLTTWSMVEAQLAIIAACIPTLKRLFEQILRRYGLISSQNSASRSRNGYYKHDGSRSRTYSHHHTQSSGHKLSALRSQRDAATVKDSATATTINAETSSIDSGEMPIMKPSHKGSIGDFESVNSSSPAPNRDNMSGDNGVYFRTAIKAGDRDRGMDGVDREGIQMETTVSVRTEPKTRPGRREGGDIV